MKNFIHRESLAFQGSTLEGWLFFLGRRFLETYPQMELLRVSGEEIRFDAQQVPGQGGGFAPSDNTSFAKKKMKLPESVNRCGFEPFGPRLMSCSSTVP